MFTSWETQANKEANRIGKINTPLHTSQLQMTIYNSIFKYKW